VREDKNAIELKGALTSVSSYSYVQSFRVNQTVSVIGGDVAQHGSVRSGRATTDAILMDDHLQFGNSPLQKGVMWGNA
jgi:hypothetical protein